MLMARGRDQNAAQWYIFPCLCPQRHSRCTNPSTGLVIQTGNCPTLLNRPKPGTVDGIDTLDSVRYCQEGNAPNRSGRTNGHQIGAAVEPSVVSITARITGSGIPPIPALVGPAIKSLRTIIGPGGRGCWPSGKQRYYSHGNYRPKDSRSTDESYHKCKTFHHNLRCTSCGRCRSAARLFELHAMLFALIFADERAGNNIAAKIAMIAMTTSNPIKSKPPLFSGPIANRFEMFKSHGF